MVTNEQMMEANRRWGEEVADQGRYEVLDEILAEDIIDELGLLRQLGLGDLPGA